MLFRTVPSANTLVRWVNENAFAFIVQARPYPTFGRPVHLRGSPHRLQPGTSPHALRIPPRDGHPGAKAKNPPGNCGAAAPGPPWSVSGFRLRARLGLSIPSSPSRPARNYPRFRIRHSSFERRRDFNPPEQRAAQRTLRTPPTSSQRQFPCYGFLGTAGKCCHFPRCWISQALKRRGSGRIFPHAPSPSTPEGPLAALTCCFPTGVRLRHIWQLGHLRLASRGRIGFTLHYGSRVRRSRLRLVRLLPRTLDWLHDKQAIHMVNSFQFTRSARLILALQI